MFSFMWGSVDILTNTWHPNPLLKMSADEQFQQNIDHGFPLYKRSDK
jgi:hypothetical protein